MVWTKTPPLSGGWSEETELDVGDKPYNSFTIQTYEDMGEARYNAVGSWGKAIKEVNPWD